MTGENFKMFIGNANNDTKKLKDEAQKTKETFWKHLKQNE